MRRYQEVNHGEAPATPSSPSDAAKAEAPAPEPQPIYRTCIVFATFLVAVILVIAVVATSGAPNTLATYRLPKVAVVIVDGLSPELLDFNRRSNKAAFCDKLIELGATFGLLQVSDEITNADAARAAILSGQPPSFSGVSSAATTGAFRNSTSFLQLAKASQKRVAVIAPTTMFSSGNSTSGECATVGLLDAECIGSSCTDASTVFCNAQVRVPTCEPVGDARNEQYVYANLRSSAAEGADVLFAQLSNVGAAGGSGSADDLAAVSEAYVADALIGRIAGMLAERSSDHPEDWLLIVTSDGMAGASRTAPFLAAKLSKGATEPLSSMSPTAAEEGDDKAPAGSVATPSLLDIFPTIVSWLGLADNLPATVEYDGIIQALCPSETGNTVRAGCPSSGGFFGEWG